MYEVIRLLFRVATSFVQQDTTTAEPVLGLPWLESPTRRENPKRYGYRLPDMALPWLTKLPKSKQLLRLLLSCMVMAHLGPRPISHASTNPRSCLSTIQWLSFL